MKLPWKNELKFWNTGEWQVIEEKLDEMVSSGVCVNPDRKSMFRALALTPLEQTKVVLLGQDPYPNPDFATGLAYSIPASISEHKWPPTLVNILREYHEDLGYRPPTSGDLTTWASRGVLLWNSIPTCTAGHSLSHNWTEYTYLTSEILQKASEQGAVIVLMGSRAREYEKYIPNADIIHTSHPSPLAYKGGRTPKNAFLGSRLFSTINARLCAKGKEAIDWRLPNGSQQL